MDRIKVTWDESIIFYERLHFITNSYFFPLYHENILEKPDPPFSFDPTFIVFLVSFSPFSLKQSFFSFSVPLSFLPFRPLKYINYTFFNPIRRGNKNRVFGTFMWSKWPKKIGLFPNFYDSASHTLLGAWNGKKGFYSIFVVS